MNPVVRQLVDRRLALGLSQREVARRAGLAQSIISEGERGNHTPGLDTLTAWADGLGAEVRLVERPKRGAR